MNRRSRIYFNRFQKSVVALVIWIGAIAEVSAYPFLLNGGMQFSLSNEKIQYDQSQTISNSAFNWGFGGQMSFGMGSNSFGVVLGNAIWFSKSKKMEQLKTLARNSPDYRLFKTEYETEFIEVENTKTRFANMVFLTYYLPHSLPFKGRFVKKWKNIMGQINPFVGVGPVMEHRFIDEDKAAFYKDSRFQKTGFAKGDVDTVDLTQTNDIMDFGYGIVLGFQINFWKKFSHKNKFVRDQIRKTWLNVEFIFYNNLTPDNENTSADNRDQMLFTEWILHIGPSTYIEL